MSVKVNYWWVLTAVCLILVFLHTVEDNFSPKLKVDITTLGLLTLAALPILREIVGTIKAGGVEVSFRELAVHQQVFRFLDGVATQRAWTFYPPRPGESELGEAFGILIKSLSRSHKKELISQLELWLEADRNNLRWFAAEIIGYFKIEELKNRLPDLYEDLDRNVSWEPWQLNCLWAYSRFENYEGLYRFLLETKSETNGLWVLDAYSQMARAKEGPDTNIMRHMAAFKERADIPQPLKLAATRVLDECNRNVTAPA